MPRGQGHVQRKADQFRTFKNAQTMLDIRQRMFSNLGLDEDFASNPFNIKLQNRVATEISRKFPHKSVDECVQQSVESAIQLTAADLYYHDPVFCTAIAPIQEESVTPFESISLVVDNYCVCVVDSSIDIDSGLIPTMCEYQPVVTPAGVSFNTHSVRYNDTEFDVKVLKSKLERLCLTDDVLNSLSDLPPEMIEEIGKHLNCREKLMIMIKSKIRFRACKHRKYHISFEPTCTGGSYSRNSQDFEFFCRYNKCYCKYYLQQQKREDLCICQSLLWYKPYLYDDSIFKWSVRHVGNNYGISLNSMGYVYSSR